jgi:hypothetical protein
MSNVVQIYPPFRPCGFCLCLQEGSVFADFNTNDDGMISLCRISFDGYGCCEPLSLPRMNAGDSQLLLDAITRNDIDSPQIKDVLQRYFGEIKDSIGSEALAEHHLI